MERVKISIPKDKTYKTIFTYDFIELLSAEKGCLSIVKNDEQLKNFLEKYTGEKWDSPEMKSQIEQENIFWNYRKFGENLDY